MPRMSMPKCAAAMCGVKVYDNGIPHAIGAVSYHSGEYGHVVDMIMSGASDDDIGLAHPAWKKCIHAVRKALSDSK